MGLTRAIAAHYDIIGIIDYEEYKDMNTIELSKLCHDKIEEYLKERIK